MTWWHRWSLAPISVSRDWRAFPAFLELPSKGRVFFQKRHLGKKGKKENVFLFFKGVLQAPASHPRNPVAAQSRSVLTVCGTKPGGSDRSSCKRSFACRKPTENNPRAEAMTPRSTSVMTREAATGAKDQVVHQEQEEVNLEHLGGYLLHRT